MGFWQRCILDQHQKELPGKTDRAGVQRIPLGRTITSLTLLGEVPPKGKSLVKSASKRKVGTYEVKGAVVLQVRSTGHQITGVSCRDEVASAKHRVRGTLVRNWADVASGWLHYMGCRDIPGG